MTFGREGNQRNTAMLQVNQSSLLLGLQMDSWENPVPNNNTMPFVFSDHEVLCRFELQDTFAFQEMH